MTSSRWSPNSPPARRTWSPSQAQLKSLKDRTGTATVTLLLREPDAAPEEESDDPTSFGDALSGGWHAFTAAVRWVLVVIGAVLPFAVAGSLLYALWRLIRNRMPAGLRRRRGAGRGHREGHAPAAARRSPARRGRRRATRRRTRPPPSGRQGGHPLAGRWLTAPLTAAGGGQRLGPGGLDLRVARRPSSRDSEDTV